MGEAGRVEEGQEFVLCPRKKTVKSASMKMEVFFSAAPCRCDRTQTLAMCVHQQHQWSDARLDVSERSSARTQRSR